MFGILVRLRDACLFAKEMTTTGEIDDYLLAKEMTACWQKR